METEYEEVTVKIPKALVDFLKALQMDPKQYVIDALVRDFTASWDMLPTETPLYDKEELAQKFGLDKILKARNNENFS